MTAVALPAEAWLLPVGGAWLLIRLMLAVEVLLTGVKGEGGGRAELVLGLQGEAGGDVFGGVGGTSS